MNTYQIRPLNPETWDAFAALVAKHNGVWGGCWCMAFHREGFTKAASAAENRDRKECLVREGRTHSAVVFDGEVAVGWCQFGSPEELPRIKHRKQYSEGNERLPDWRITCFFVDKDYRGKGVAKAALAGAIAQIAKLGGGVVESYPEDVEGRKVSSSFIHNGSLTMFEQQGFERERPLGKNHWVVKLTVEPMD